jgi:excisionase family DNA binding protein
MKIESDERRSRVLGHRSDVNVSGTAPLAFTALAFRADEAARCIGATTFFIEEIMRSGELPFLTLGKRRVICLDDLKMWFEKERREQHRRLAVAA